ncbi:MAG: hypothetical protein ABH815_03355 [Candidatus Omnitrophota bacterium]
MKRIIILSILFTFCFSGRAFSYEAWKLASGIKEAKIEEVASDPDKEGVVYTASTKNLYKTEDDGKTWRAVFSAKGDGDKINFISMLKQGIFVCTEKGMFRSIDGKSGWKKIFKGIGMEENSASHIAVFQDGTMYLGTKGGLFISRDDGTEWVKDIGEAGNLRIKWIAFQEKDIFLAAEDGVYRSIDKGWKRVFVVTTEEGEYDSDSQDEYTSASKPVNSIFIDKERIFLATDEGVFSSGDKGVSWKRFSSNGLLSPRIKRIVSLNNKLYAATDKGIFFFDEADGIWDSSYKGISTDRINSFSISNKGTMWVATDKGLYYSKSGHVKQVDLEVENVLGLFGNEPGIREVQEIAIKYAEVHPDKIKKWRESARKKALLPNVSVGVDRYVTDYYHWDAGQNPDVLVKGDDVVSWDLTMTWDLGELIWNDDQTSIDTRSRLMVQLRDDVLGEITRTYFERRRLQIETHLSQPDNQSKRIEKRLRIDELTADLDAMTGGYFSKSLN